MTAQTDLTTIPYARNFSPERLPRYLTGLRIARYLAGPLLLLSLLLT